MDSRPKAEQLWVACALSVGQRQSTCWKLTRSPLQSHTRTHRCVRCNTADPISRPAIVSRTLATSLSYDIKLPNGQSTRHTNANRFIDSIRERLAHAIQIYEKTPLGRKVSLIGNMQVFFLIISDHLWTAGGDRFRSSPCIEFHRNRYDCSADRWNMRSALWCHFVSHVVIQMHTQIFTGHIQPVKEAIIRIFPYVCTYFDLDARFTEPYSDHCLALRVG